MESNATVVAAQPASPANKYDWMESLAHQLRYSSTGQRAALRRVALTQSFKADAVVIAFITKANVPEKDRQHDFDRWRMIAHFATMLVGTGEPGPDRPFVQAESRKLGSILGKLDYSETRLLRLLSVRGEALDDQVRRIASFLPQKDKIFELKDRRRVNLWTLYDLLDGGGDGDRAKSARIKIAHDYYTAKS